ncbi:MAG: OmpA family protein [Clostridia bacterium]|nr:OmpA family protein [Clostridia bacterium]
MKTRKIIALALATVCLLSFASCGEKVKNPNAPVTAPSATLATSAPTFSENVSSVLDREDVNAVLNELGVDLYNASGEMGVVSVSAETQVNLGYETDSDLTALLRPGEVSPDIEVCKDGKELIVSIVNPYDTETEIRNGIVSSCTVVGADSNDFGGFSFGKATPEQVAEKLGQPYEAAEDSVVYRVFASKALELGSLGKLYAGFSADSLKNLKLIFAFVGGVLSSVTLEDPSLSNGGLEESVAPEELENITYEEQTEIVEIRISILESLTESFSQAEIDVRVDPQTGEIALSDSVLFGNESYELSEDGKAYLDKVFGVYAETLLEGEYADRVSAVVFEGHTNTLGTFEYNQDLSEKRANAVLTHCLASEVNGLDSEQKAQVEALAETVGRAYTDPVFTSDGEIDMEASRRVCLKFRISAE